MIDPNYYQRFADLGCTVWPIGNGGGGSWGFDISCYTVRITNRQGSDIPTPAIEDSTITVRCKCEYHTLRGRKIVAYNPHTLDAALQQIIQIKNWYKYPCRFQPYGYPDIGDIYRTPTGCKPIILHEPKPFDRDPYFRP